jgi:hypothetical protein
MIRLTGLLPRLLVLAACLSGVGCGKDENEVTKAEKIAVQSSVEMNSADGVADTTSYLRYEGGWLTDSKGGKLRVIRCVLTQGKPPQQFDLLFKVEKSQGRDHAIDQAVNPAGENWRTADKIPWVSQKPKDE